MDGPQPPPPPPPHGEKPSTTHGEYRKASDLPEGNYDIFIIPPHSAGSGFLYLPSLQCSRNSFLAGSLSTLVVVFLWTTLSPWLKVWYGTTIASGNSMGTALLAIMVGAAGWLAGARQADSNPQRESRFGGFGGFGRFGGLGGFGFGSRGWGSGPQAHSQSSNAGESNPRANSGGPQSGQGNSSTPGGGTNTGFRGAEYTNDRGHYSNQHNNPHRSRQESQDGSRPKSHAGDSPPNQSKGPYPNWDRAREETKRKEDIRRKMEEFKRKREAEAREKERQREREERERERREQEERIKKEIAEARAAAAKEAREQAEREAEVRAAAAKEAREQAEREAEARENVRREAEARERVEKEAEAKAKAKLEADAKFAALKEAAAKKYAEKRAKDAHESANRERMCASGTPRTPSPKKASIPTARTAAEDDDIYSFRPYDRPRRPYAGTSGSSMYSESSCAASQSTAPTTPPSSQRGAYSTKDPDKIVIRGVYVFNNAFPKAPAAQLVSGQGVVTDGLVLRITTEGLFIDDDIRGVPQREWDVKAWTMKLAEVWCPQLVAAQSRQSAPKPSPFRWNSSHTSPTAEESETCLANLLKLCRNTCRLASPACFSRSGDGVGAGDIEQRGLHVLRASLRGQEGKHYVFVLQGAEGWKVAIGLQRLQRGTQVRALGVCSMTTNDYKSLLGGLGYI